MSYGNEGLAARLSHARFFVWYILLNRRTISRVEYGPRNRILLRIKIYLGDFLINNRDVYNFTCHTHRYSDKPPYYEVNIYDERSFASPFFYLSKGSASFSFFFVELSLLSFSL